MKKKLLALLLVVVMLISIVPVTAFADDLETRTYHGSYWPWFPPMPEVHECEFVEVGRDPATCLEDGTIYYKCKCGETKEDPIPAPGSHTEVTDEAVDATCTTDGKTAGSHCSACGEVFVEQEVIPAGHTPVTTVQAVYKPTCEAFGYGWEYKVCEDCNKPLTPAYQWKWVVIDKLPHTEVILAAELATCTKPGKSAGKACSVCGEILKAQEEVPVLEHTPVVDEAVAATCYTPGWTEGSHCGACGKVLTAQKFIPAGHKYEIVKETVKNPTCTEEGLKVAKWQCSVCDHQRGFVFGWDWWYETIKMVPHELEPVAAVDPTCTENGLTAGNQCKNCDYEDGQEVIDKLGHAIITIAGKDPTCTEEGATDHTECTRCGIVLTEKKPIKALGHDPKTYPGREATCTEEGATAHDECQRCGIVLTEKVEIPAKGHTEKVVPAVAPTCEATGLTEGKVCSVCGEVLVKQEVVAAIGHAWDEGKITTPATDKADGVKTYTCKNDPTHIKTEAVKYVAPDKDLDEVPKTGDNSGVILATMTGIAMLTAVAYVFGKKRSVR